MAEQQNTNGGGRILYDEQGMRVVELSSTTNLYSLPTYQQKVAAIDMSGYEPTVRLIAPDVESVQREVPLTFEEVNILISSYQTFLADREKAAQEEAARRDRIVDEFDLF
jgi:tRNA uridine 5-carbamoylmethylation protein Kti12